MNEISIRKALNDAFKKVSPSRDEINSFKDNLILLLKKVKEKEQEEHNKNWLRDFLKAKLGSDYTINTKGNIDLVIYTKETTDSNAGVLIEVKKPNKKTEMISKDNFDAKSLQQLLYYFLEERIINNNLHLTHLIITDVYQWYIFDAKLFETLFVNDKKLVETFKKYKENKLSISGTNTFYSEIAKTAIEKVQEKLSFTHFDIRDYEQYLKPNKAANEEADKALIALFKVLSPEHLLKLPFSNDSNSLNTGFYNELLHIIGLHETGESKKTIERLPKGKRNAGSLLENTIEKLNSTNKIHRLKNVKQYGDTYDEQLFTVALELVITWVNRILFLKLLEAQLLSYHKGNKEYAFLNFDKLQDYDEVEVLFFEVLAKQVNQRSAFNQKTFGKVPYLNSSLFEPTELENNTIEISGLRDRYELPLYTKTVFKDANGNRLSGQRNTLEYFLGFLDAYDFASEGKEIIREQKKTIINASVLGLIFEKINGYKDGSFFTPGAITMYMCRETLRKAVIQKFNEVKGWDYQTLEDLHNKIAKEDIEKEANDIVNSIKICDPAVGSGHFLVSALNEMLAIKSELGIILDDNGKMFKGLKITVANDELIVKDYEENLFEYNPNSTESKRLQKTLFHEKQTIIENCLFGVDINPNSVKICRLRLWIELLKNAYYKNDTELETLPNIDINIKVGNSLISRFELDTDLKQALKKQKLTITDYRNAVSKYRQANNKTDKWAMLDLINKIKSDFRTSITQNSKEHKRLVKLSEELYYKYKASSLFDTELTDKQIAEKTKLTEQVEKLQATIDEIDNNVIYRDAFEWRFEFPEILNEEGDFMGFDAIIGNPPYVQLQKMETAIKNGFKAKGYTTYSATGDIYELFYEKGTDILKHKGVLTYITSNKWMRANYGKSTRKFFADLNPLLLIDFGGVQIFDSATVDTNILMIQKHKNQNQTLACLFDDKYTKGSAFDSFINANKVPLKNLNENAWIVTDTLSLKIKEKIERVGTPLKDWDINIYRGILTGYNEAFIITTEVRNRLVEEDPKSAEIIKPILRGQDIKRYQADWADLWLISTFPALKINIENYPAVLKFLSVFRPKLEQIGKKLTNEQMKSIMQHAESYGITLTESYLKTSRKKTTNKWFETQDSIAYWQDFEKEKIVWARLTRLSKTDERDFPRFLYDNKNCYTLDSCCIITGGAPKYLLALLNSYVAEKFFLDNVAILDNGGFQMRQQFVEHLPVPIITKSQQQPFITKVNDILALKKEGKDTTVIEQEIDNMVYKLYDLTYEEVLIVQPDFGEVMSEAEYERYSIEAS